MIQKWRTSTKTITNQHLHDDRPQSTTQYLSLYTASSYGRRGVLDGSRETRFLGLPSREICRNIILFLLAYFRWFVTALQIECTCVISHHSTFKKSIIQIYGFLPATTSGPAKDALDQVDAWAGAYLKWRTRKTACQEFKIETQTEFHLSSARFNSPSWMVMKGLVKIGLL